MAQLNVRLDDDTRESFDALARARGMSASDLIRSLIDAALGRDNPDRRHGDVTPRSLSAIHRRMLANQHEILAILTADPQRADAGGESDYHRNMVEVLSSGYSSEYADMFLAVRPEMSRRDSSLVHDIFDMFQSIEWSLKRLSAEERAGLGEYVDHALRFRGFDFNDTYEGRLASYALYLIKTGRWESMAEHFDDKHERGNSHMPALASYERMLTVWRPMWKRRVADFSRPDGYILTAEELREILAAWPYPKD